MKRRIISLLLILVLLLSSMPTVFADDSSEPKADANQEIQAEEERDSSNIVAPESANSQEQQEPAVEGAGANNNSVVGIDLQALENEIIKKTSENDQYYLEDPVDLYKRYASTKERTSLTDTFNMEDPDFMSSFSSIALKEAGADDISFFSGEEAAVSTPEEVLEKANRIVQQMFALPQPQYGSMPDIAEIVLAYEEPTAFKYQNWFFRDEIERLGPEFYYPPVIYHDLIFVTWCADQLGYVRHGYFPIAESTTELFNALVDNGNKAFSRSDQFMTPQQNDLMFEPGITGEYKVSIVVSVKDEEIAYVGCDQSGFAEYHVCNLSALPRNTRFLRMTEVTNKNLLAAANFIEKTLGVEPSVAAAILANMYHESRFSPLALGDAGTSFGLCQWHEERWDSLIQFCIENGYDWKTTNGQMHFLIYELSTQDKYVGLVQDMINCDNSAIGAYQCAYQFCIKFEKPQDSELKGDVRGLYAYNTIFPLLFSQQMMEQMIEEEENKLVHEAEMQAAEEQRIEEEAARAEAEEAARIAEEKAKQEAEAAKKAEEKKAAEAKKAAEKETAEVKKAADEEEAKEKQEPEQETSEATELVAAILKNDSDAIESIRSKHLEEQADELEKPAQELESSETSTLQEDESQN